MLWLPKLITYLGLVLLIGGLLRRRAFTLPTPAPVWPTVTGALLTALGGLLEAGASLAGVLGPFAPADYLAYLTQSEQGAWVLARAALACLLAALEAARPRPTWPGALLTAALLLTVSAVGHARASGWPWVALDALHLAAMGVWVGAVALLAWRPLARWDGAQVPAAVILTSRLALISVGVLVLTGTLAALHHLPGWGALWGSSYGVTLLVKLGIFALALVLAALNRQVLMRQPTWRPLALAMRGETLFLLGALTASGVLATGTLPERPLAAITTPVQLRFANGIVNGILRVQNGTLHAELSDQPAPELRLLMLDHTMPPVNVPLEHTGTHLQGEADLWMSGHWLVQLSVNGETHEIPVQLQ